jgi:hypothetical protein
MSNYYIIKIFKLKILKYKKLYKKYIFYLSDLINYNFFYKKKIKNINSNIIKFLNSSIIKSNSLSFFNFLFFLSFFFSFN